MTARAIYGGLALNSEPVDKLGVVERHVDVRYPDAPARARGKIIDKLMKYNDIKLISYNNRNTTFTVRKFAPGLFVYDLAYETLIK